MIPTPRLVALAGLGTGIAVWGVWNAGFETLLVAYNVVLIALVAVDAFWTPRPREVVVERRLDPIFSLGPPNRVRIAVRNRSRHPLRVRVRDHYPPEFAASAETVEAAVAPREEKEVAYELRPRRRGAYEFRDLYFRYPSRLGLLYRQGWTAAARPLRVYPNLKDLRRYELLSRQGRLQELGLRNARRFGGGTEFEAVREYVPDDDFRRINWKATARRGTPATNQYDIERSQTVLLVLEAGRLMGARVGSLTKLDLALNAALLVGQVAVSSGDRVGLLAYGTQIARYVAPQKGRAHLYRVIESVYDLQPELLEPDPERALSYLQARNRKRALVIVFTELIDADASRGLLRGVAQLVPRHQVMCVTLQDPLIAALSHVRPENAQGAYEKAVASMVLQHRDRASAFLSARGIAVVNQPPEKLSLGVINQYLELKGKARL